MEVFSDMVGIGELHGISQFPMPVTRLLQQSKFKGAKAKT